MVKNMEIISQFELFMTPDGKAVVKRPKDGAIVYLPDYSKFKGVPPKAGETWVCRCNGDNSISKLKKKSTLGIPGTQRIILPSVYSIFRGIKKF